MVAAGCLALRHGRRQLPPFLIKRLVWWAEHEFRKLKPLPEGGTLGDAFASYRRQVGRPHPEDKEHIRAPETLIYLWENFWEIAQGRPLGPEGIQLPIPHTEIRAWAELREITLASWELTAIRALDSTYLKVAAEKGV